MEIKLIRLKRKDKELSEFTDKEWELIHPEHYGQKYNRKYWNEKSLRIEAKRGDKIIGALRGILIAGVLEIFQVIVHRDCRGQGIGKMLMVDAEKWAKQNGGHEVFLSTGEKWASVNFYKKLGYELIARLPNHYSKTDFVLFRKFLD